MLPRTLVLVLSFALAGCATLPFRTRELSLDGEVWRFQVHRLPGNDATLPLDLALDADGNVWVTGEFGADVFRLAAGARRVERLTVPRAATPIFWNASLGGPTNRSSLAEDIEADSRGRVWFSQGGDYLFAGPEPNASRVVRFDPRDASWACFHLPWDNAQAMGLAMGPAADRVFVATAGPGGNAVIEFEPDTFSAADSDCHFDHRTEPPAGECGGGERARCFRRHPMPLPGIQPAQLVLADDGSLWGSAFFASSLFHLDPATGAVEIFPLPPARGTSYQARMLGSGPWDIHWDRIRDGRLWVSDFFDGELIEFDTDRSTREDCTRLAEERRNPCVVQYPIPGLDLDNEFVHSLALDAAGNKWFSVQTLERVPGQGRIGRLTADGRMQLFPPLTELDFQGGATGIAVDPRSGDLWFAGFWQRAIGRLQRR